MTSLIETIDLTASARDLTARYNEFAFELGEPEVARFKDRPSLERRLRAMAQRVEEDRAAKLAKHVECYSLPIEKIVEELGKISPELAVSLSFEDKAQIADEAACRPAPETLRKPLSEHLLERAASEARKPTPRWARPKEEQPARIAYRPRPNSSQMVMYRMLTAEGGIRVEDFCAAMRYSGAKDRTLHSPSTVWSCLRYLFVAGKGYGLRFDGERIALIVPADERDSVAAREA